VASVPLNYRSWKSTKNVELMWGFTLRRHGLRGI
jgi:hypothetical protein